MNKIFGKIFFSVIGIFFLAVFLLLAWLFAGPSAENGEMEFGVTFSQPFAEKLGLNWQEIYLAIFDDLGAKKMRLPVYWDKIEREKGVFNFADVDWQIEKAAEKNAEIILAIGQKLPRWPECHLPDWARNLDKKERQEYLKKYISAVVERYRGRSVIVYWQVENEPFLRHFGECASFDKEFLDEEIALVRSLDSRPIIVTASGELDPWLGAARRADKMGTTLYRLIWNKYVGYFRYPIPAGFYPRKAALIKKLTGVKDIFICELQGEPWGPKMLYETTPDEQLKNYSLKEFQDTVAYARRTGLQESYLWGVEWWYWMRTKYQRPEFWEEAKKNF